MHTGIPLVTNLLQSASTWLSGWDGGDVNKGGDFVPWGASQPPPAAPHPTPTLEAPVQVQGQKGR